MFKNMGMYILWVKNSIKIIFKFKKNPPSQCMISSHRLLLSTCYYEKVKLMSLIQICVGPRQIAKKNTNGQFFFKNLDEIRRLKLTLLDQGYYIGSLVGLNDRPFFFQKYDNAFFQVERRSV